MIRVAEQERTRVLELHKGPCCKPISAVDQMCDLEQVASRRLGFFNMHALDIIVKNWSQCIERPAPCLVPGGGLINDGRSCWVIITVAA